MIIIQNNGENNGEVFNEKYIYYMLYNSHTLV